MIAQAGQAFNANSMVTVTGKVVGIKHVPRARRVGTGEHLEVSVNGKPITVLLGPSWYVNQQGVTLNAGDTVQVSGSQVTSNGQTEIIATEVRKGQQVLRLRQANGVPLWSGGRR